jgi:hypothetical protein
MFIGGEGIALQEKKRDREGEGLERKDGICFTFSLDYREEHLDFTEPLQLDC